MKKLFLLLLTSFGLQAATEADCVNQNVSADEQRKAVTVYLKMIHDELNRLTQECLAKDAEIQQMRAVIAAFKENGVLIEISFEPNTAQNATDQAQVQAEASHDQSIRTENQ